MEWLQWIHGTPKENTAAGLHPGDEVRVWYRILEQGKERLGQFEGTVIRTRGARASRTYTVRRVTFGEGVERVFPVDSKTVAKIDVLRHGHLKRATLYYLRTKIGKVRVESTDAMATKAVRAASESNKAAESAAVVAEKSTTTT
ncbi:MAG: 50S ribosomal protein L19 [Candidatus Omnitrophica bacterium]|nr:50S ribosomal protein L19 [Candidatus Omnitrophota bacterium]